MARKKHAIDSATASKDLSGKTYIVTGANSGVGLETTRQLVKQGGHVVMACRRVDAGEEAAVSSCNAGFAKLSGDVDHTEDGLEATIAVSYFGQGSSAVMDMLMKVMAPLMKTMSDCNEESAQTSLHCLISDDTPHHSGEYFSQSSVLYRDLGTKNGGWPMKSPNPNATDTDQARRLVEVSYELVGLEKPSVSP